MTAKQKFFISYRRKGSGAGYALALYDQLRRVASARRVFLDVADNAIELGEDWRQKVRKAVRGTQVLVVIDGT